MQRRRNAVQVSQFSAGDAGMIGDAKAGRVIQRPIVGQGWHEHLAQRVGESAGDVRDGQRVGCFVVGKRRLPTQRRPAVVELDMGVRPGSGRCRGR